MVEEFRKTLASVRSRTTVLAYVAAARRLEALCHGEYSSPALLHSFVQSLCQQGLSPPSVHVYKAGAVRYLEFLRLQGVAVAPQASPLLPAKRDPVRQVFTYTQLARYMDLCRPYPEPMSTLTRLIPLTGFRVDEMCSLEVNDVQVGKVKVAGKPTLQFHLRVKDGKGRAGRVVPLLSAGTPILLVYLGRVRPTLQIDRSLWPGVSVAAVERTVREIREKMGVEVLTPHTLRHVYASILEQAGVSPFKIQALMGHKSIRTTSRYVHVIGDDLGQAVVDVKTPWAEEKRDE